MTIFRVEFEFGKLKLETNFEDRVLRVHAHTLDAELEKKRHLIAY